MTKYSPVLNTTELHLRPGEQMHITNLPFDQEACYAVMLHPAPEFPGSQKYEAALSYTVICAAWHNLSDTPDEYKWGWAHLGADTKEIIGSLLIEYGAEPGRWYYLLISGGIGHRPGSHFESSYN